MAELSLKDLEGILIEKLSQRYKITKSDMKRVFSQADSDKSGFLNLEELLNIFERFLVGVNRSKIEELISCYDINGDGFLSFDDFFDFLKNRNATRSPHGRNHSYLTTVKENPDNVSSEFDPSCARELHCRVTMFLQNLRSYLLQKGQKIRKKEVIENRLMVHSHQLAVHVGQEALLRIFSQATGSFRVPVEEFFRFTNEWYGDHYF
jgi:hypothetical protein